jgi:peptidoglycan-associated lipoprotein
MRAILTIACAFILAGCHTIRDRPYVAPVRPGETVDPAPPKTTEAPPVEDIPPSPPPPSRPELRPPPRKDAAIVVAETNEQLRDIFFGYDRSDLSQASLAALQADARLLAPVLQELPNIKVTVEGHCDERGSAEYNLALADRRASQTASTLHSLGVPAGRIETISYGKERPQCEEPRESCWQRNRRAHLALSLTEPTPTTP